MVDEVRAETFTAHRNQGKTDRSPVSTCSLHQSNRFLIRNLVRREVRGRYRNALLGYAWAFIEPALFALVYWFLFIMLSGNPDKMYAVWVLIGKWFGDALAKR